MKNKERLMKTEETATNRRKQDHLEACLNDGVDLGRDSFGSLKLRYNALPGLALEEVSTETRFAGKIISAPLIISGMTGGVGPEFIRINRNLARGAQQLGIPFGLGSMKVLLAQPEALESFDMRAYAPDVPIIANLGLVSFNYGLGLADVKDLIRDLQPDAFGFHLNALQEVAMDEGDTDFRGLAERLTALKSQLDLPLYLKECGGGIAPEQVRIISQAGADYIDVSGNDGTSWAAVEARRSSNPALGELFSDFGLPTTWILKNLSPDQVGKSQIVAGGGIRDGIQAAKALALGARFVSVARPFLIAATESEAAVVACGERLIRELRTAMFLTGSASLADLNRDLFIEGV